MVTLGTAALCSAPEQVQRGQRQGSPYSSTSTNLLTTLGEKSINGEKMEVPVSHGLCAEIFSSGVVLEIDIYHPGIRLFSERQ